MVIFKNIQHLDKKVATNILYIVRKEIINNKIMKGLTETFQVLLTVVSF